MKFNLSETAELIRSRRSIPPENFTDRKVHREMIEWILTNATWAPSHGLTQPWRFKVFSDEGLDKLCDTLPEVYRRTTAPESFRQPKYDKLKARLQKVSVVIVVCMERDRSERIAEIEEVEAVACAVQNMYLSCTAYGLGSFFSSPGFVYSQEMKDLLRLDARDQCLGLFYIGYPAVPWPVSHRKPLEYVAVWIDK